MNKHKQKGYPNFLTHHTYVSSPLSTTAGDTHPFFLLAPLLDTQLETLWGRETIVLVFRAQGVHEDITLVIFSILSSVYRPQKTKVMFLSLVEYSDTSITCYSEPLREHQVVFYMKWVSMRF